ncbi:metal ABC transporter substrate-binding protein [Desulfovibrio ferrophilus]|uniref:ABC-type metal ion transporter, periplasmic subunit n=1 Tax=Desulfovibrio ferrophilus TaxID=241368 RepID=A0A2Z6B2R4_9BACT|nr:zinc ABC transporter substrate-binding protein [Desulfovibrio ferrophilus]BBD09824.1 ABC-type metal ion transporter, periplasmic subunit [Desulfovibrio ferrophilus]
MIMRIVPALLICLSLMLPRPAQAEDQPLRLLAGTTMLADILHDLCPQAEVRALIPGGACPGHYDLRPADLVLLNKAEALFLHPWQQDLENMRILIDAAANAQLHVEIVAEPGNSMLPQVHARYTRAMAQRLGEIAPQQNQAIQNAAKRRLARITTLEQELLFRLHQAGAQRHPVVCAQMQEGLARWAGFPVATVFYRPGDMNPEQMARVVDAGKSGKATLVIDNLQSGDGGRGLAEELSARRIMLSNFPGGFPDTNTWEDALRVNIERLLNALQGSEYNS